MAMGRGGQGEVLRQIRTLFEAGAVGGLTDGQLLKQYQARDGEAGERAFAALVERHGPMIWRVCRRTLRDEHAAQDAFQATFLVLVRKEGSLQARGSLAPWLHAVASRVAACARTASARRQALERRAAERAQAPPDDRGADDLGRVLHEEIDRLPETFRAAVILCDLEGLTQEQAAHQLGWPAGTVRSRLARGRGRLQARLARLGLAPAAGVVAAWLTAEAATAAVPAPLVVETVRAAALAAAGQAAAGSVAAALLTEGVLRAMFMTRLKLISATLLLIGVGASGTAVLALQPYPGPSVGPTATAATSDRGPSSNVDAADTMPDVPAPPPLQPAEDRLSLAESKLKRAQDRLVWSVRMFEKGYVSWAELSADRQSAEQARLALKQARQEPDPRTPTPPRGGGPAEGQDGDEVGYLSAQVRAKQAELQAGEARLKEARANETGKLILRDKDPGALSEALWNLAEAESLAATADCNLKRAELKLLQLRLSRAKR